MRQNRVISLPVIFRLADGEGAMKVWLSGPKPFAGVVPSTTAIRDGRARGAPLIQRGIPIGRWLPVACAIPLGLAASALQAKCNARRAPRVLIG